VAGAPAIELRAYKMAVLQMLNLPEIVKRVRALERQMPAPKGPSAGA
jgi:hypothetical protein